MGDGMDSFLAGGYQCLILLYRLLQLPDQVRRFSFVPIDTIGITVYDDVGDHQQKEDESCQATYLHKRLFPHGGYLGFTFLQVGLHFFIHLADKPVQLPVKFRIPCRKAVGVFRQTAALCRCCSAIISRSRERSIVVVTVGFWLSFLPNMPRNPFRFGFCGCSCTLFCTITGTCRAIFSLRTCCSSST